jgi:SpoVK/Ycf46/Vps4 family AAA+-type ATPase
MSLAERMSEMVRACFSGLWVQSHEHEDALAEIAQLCRDESWRLASWDVEQGLNVFGQDQRVETGTGDPLAAIRSLGTLAGAGEGTGESMPALLVLVNFHRFLNSGEIEQALARQIIAGKQNRTFIVILSPVVQVPTELEKQFVIIEHDLPGREQLAEIARGVATNQNELPTGQEFERVIDAALGLTRYEAEGAFSLSLVRHDRLQADVLWEQKAQMLKKSGLLSLHRGSDDFSTLGGLDALKSFCKRSLLQPSRNSNRKRARGVLLLGVPGTGKSAFAKALGKETGRPTLVLDIGALMGSLVGQTEQNIRQALKIADAMSPCICFVDEIEKALSGVGNSGDSGVSTRLFGTLLSWMNDHTSDVYLIATCNDISKLPPEFSRAERFDGIFFLNLPQGPEKRRIWQMYLSYYGLDAQQNLPADDSWTGAEIKSCCRLAALLDVPLVAAAQNVVPVAMTAAESVERLQAWASGRCLSADQPGIYQRQGKASARRKLTRNEPSDN